MLQNKTPNSKEIGEKKHVSAGNGWFIIILNIYSVFYIGLMNIDTNQKMLKPIFLVLPVIINIFIVFLVIPTIYLTKNYIRFRKFGRTSKSYRWNDIRKVNITIINKTKFYEDVDEATVELFLKHSSEQPKMKVKVNRFESDIISNIKTTCDDYNIPLISNVNIQRYIECEDIDEYLGL